MVPVPLPVTVTPNASDAANVPVARRKGRVLGAAQAVDVGEGDAVDRDGGVGKPRIGRRRGHARACRSPH